MTDHTPGPWHYRPRTDDDWGKQSRRGIWCPRHPASQLVRIELPNGKIDLRCPACTAARVANIHEVEKPSS